MDDFLANLDGAEPGTGNRCTVTRVLDELPADRAAKLREALASKVTSARLARALEHSGIRLPANTVGRHRRHECRCES